MEKIKLGIPGLDEILNGGIREGCMVLFSGSPGTGKSIASMQFIYSGAKKGIPGMFITSEETAFSLREDMKSVGFDIAGFENKGMITVVEQSVTGGGMISIEAPLKLIQKRKIKRVVLDSLTLFEYVYGSSVNEFRKGIVSFIKQMKEAGVTLVVTSERQLFDGIQYRPEDYLFDGLVLMSLVRKGASFDRVIQVAKMRGQNHMINIFPFQIGKGGITVFPNEVPFSLIEQDVIKRSKK
ncbi:MAG: ATPase domain-containing protein [Nanoarchaeota archaeon]|nr:ATPase domain-containing protein [Nanoarchaeota archaeon]